VWQRERASWNGYRSASEQTANAKHQHSWDVQSIDLIKPIYAEIADVKKNEDVCFSGSQARSCSKLSVKPSMQCIHDQALKNNYERQIIVHLPALQADHPRC